MPAMGNLVAYDLAGPVASITLDDGKVNALSPQMLAEIGAALDQAEADSAAVLLTGALAAIRAAIEADHAPAAA
jgi:enoyl-CoA hydratase